MSLQDADTQDGINAKLDTVIKLLAAMYARDRKNNDAIISLDKMQVSRDSIAQAVGVSTHNVSQVLYASKKGEEKKKPKGATISDASEPVTSGAEVQQ
jgi:hypothetical protein